MSPILQSCSGTGSAVGAGWGLSGVDQLVSIGGGVNTVSGVLWVYGAGGWRFFPSLGGNRYLSPPDDFGTLVKNLDGSGKTRGDSLRISGAAWYFRNMGVAGCAVALSPTPSRHPPRSGQQGTGEEFHSPFCRAPGASAGPRSPQARGKTGA